MPELAVILSFVGTTVALIVLYQSQLRLAEAKEKRYNEIERQIAILRLEFTEFATNTRERLEKINKRF